MDEGHKAAADQFANIEIIRVMMLELWVHFLGEEADPQATASKLRDRQLSALQRALDHSPGSYIRQALFNCAEQNWQQILEQLKAGRSGP